MRTITMANAIRNHTHCIGHPQSPERCAKDLGQCECLELAEAIVHALKKEAYNPNPHRLEELKAATADRDKKMWEDFKKNPNIDKIGAKYNLRHPRQVFRKMFNVGLISRDEFHKYFSDAHEFLEDRNVQIWNDRKVHRWTLAKLGKKHGVSANRVRQIFLTLRERGLITELEFVRYSGPRVLSEHEALVRMGRKKQKEGSRLERQKALAEKLRPLFRSR